MGEGKSGHAASGGEDPSTQASSSRSRRVLNSAILTSGNYVTAGISLVTQIFIFRFFGVGRELDAYYAAGVIPSLITMTINNTQRSVLIPAFGSYSFQRADSNRDWLVSSILLITLLVVGILALCLASGSRWLLAATLPGFAEPALRKTGVYFLFLLLSIPLSTAIGTFYCLLTSQEHFIDQASSTLIPPVVLLLAILLFLGKLGVMALIAGTLCGSALQLLFLIGMAYGRGVFRLQLRFFHPRLKGLLNNSLPLLGSNLVSRSSQLIEKLLGSLLSPGAITILELGRGVSGYANQTVSNLNLASFPEMSRAAQEKDRTRMGGILTQNQITMLVGMSFMLVAFISFGKPFIRLLTGNKFDSNVFSISSVVVVMVIQLVAAFTAALAGTLTYWFYACEKTLVPALANSSSLLIMGLTAWGLTHVLGVFGLAIAGAIQYGFILVLLTFLIERFGRGTVLNRKLMKSTGKLLLVTACSCLVWLGLTQFFPAQGAGSSVKEVSVALVTMGGFLVFAYLSHVSEVQWIITGIKKRFITEPKSF
jgi:putative peptidoglycan lipid II flippase